MKTITFPLKLHMKRPQVGDLQEAMQLLLERSVLLSNDDATRREVSRRKRGGARKATMPTFR